MKWHISCKECDLIHTYEGFRKLPLAFIAWPDAGAWDRICDCGYPIIPTAQQILDAAKEEVEESRKERANERLNRRKKHAFAWKKAKRAQSKAKGLNVRQSWRRENNRCHPDA